MKKLNFWLVLILLSSQESSAGEVLPGVDAAPWVGIDFKGLPCKGIEQGYGPFDYTNHAHKTGFEGGSRITRLEVVERRHFPPNTEYLIKPVFSYFLGDMAYTLMAWPNHHRALLSMIRFDLEVRNKLRKPEPVETEVECWFQRALNFSPKDWATHSIYGRYLHKIGKFEESKTTFETALKIKPDESKLEYSYSLLLIDMKDYEHALEHAKRAYELGKPPKGLKEKLTKLGVWK